MSKRNVKHRRIFLVLLSFLVILSSGIFWNDAEADVLQRGPELKKSDPLMKIMASRFGTKIQLAQC